HHRAWTGEDFGDKLPRQTLRERIVTCFIEDPTGVKLRHDIDIDTITWESDYPHSDSTWPNSPATRWKKIGEIPDEDIDNIKQRNAMRVCHLNPCSTRPRATCTVRALRAEATDVYTGYHDAPKRGWLPATASALSDRITESKS